MEKYFYEVFANMQRLGPGSEKATLEAIAEMTNESAIKILDIGCGVGTHTFVVASALTNAQITAIDNNPEYIEALNKQAAHLGLKARVQGICMSMFEMTFEPNSFDYIFAEGAIYIAGFVEGLKEWQKFLKPNGAIICSEISWIVENPSPEIKKYWENAYPQIDTIENKITQAEGLGYTCTKSAILPPDCWTDNYYTPLQANLDKMRVRYEGVEEAQQVIGIIEQEIDMYNRYGSEYSYVFYTLKLVP